MHHVAGDPAPARFIQVTHHMGGTFRAYMSDDQFYDLILSLREKY
jgi:hypothetical protein